MKVRTIAGYASVCSSRVDAVGQTAEWGNERRQTQKSNRLARWRSDRMEFYSSVIPKAATIFADRHGRRIKPIVKHRASD